MKMITLAMSEEPTVFGTSNLYFQIASCLLTLRPTKVDLARQIVPDPTQGKQLGLLL